MYKNFKILEIKHRLSSWQKSKHVKDYLKENRKSKFFYNRWKQ